MSNWTELAFAFLFAIAFSFIAIIYLEYVVAIDQIEDAYVAYVINR